MLKFSALESESGSFSFSLATPKSQPEARGGALEKYLSNIHALPNFNLGNDESCPLLWWKVSMGTPCKQTGVDAHRQVHGGSFDNELRGMARDFLGAAGSSAATERLFSAAADTCKQSRGSLKTSTMERSIASAQWLKCGLKPGAKWKAALEWRDLKAAEFNALTASRKQT